MALRIADRWFERRTVSDDITLLFEPHAHPLLRCNIWHVRGREQDLLVDTGLGVAPLRDAMRDLIDKPIVAVATHIHYDHVGSLHEFEHRVMHRAEAPRMEDYREFCALATSQLPAELREGLAAMGMPIGGEALLDALPHVGFDLEAFQTPSAALTRIVDEGDPIELGDRHFEVLHLPGHSPGSIGLWEAGSGTLFSGDAIYDGLLLDDLPDSDVSEYCDTMRRLRGLPVQLVHGGHEPSFGRERLVEIADAYLELRS